MTDAEFSSFVEWLENEDTDFARINTSVMHAVVGIASEAGELVGILKKVAAYHQPLDMEDVKEEAADILHYLQMLCNSQDWTLIDLMEANVIKLGKRYPGGFTYKCAKNRMDKKKDDKSYQTTDHR